MFKPVFKGNMLTIGVSESPLAIVTLWSDKNLVAASLKPEHYGVIGQLYSSTRGLDPIVRNLLANTHIRYLIVYGNDLSGSGAVLRDFFKKGFEKGRDSVGNECWRVRSDKDGFIDIEVTEQALQLLRDNVTLIGAKSLDELLEYAKRLSAKKGTPYSQPMFFEKKPREAATIKGEDSAFRVSGKKVAEVWVKLLDIIMKFGRVSPTHYDSRMKEVVDLISVVTDEDPEGMCVPDFLPCNEKMLEEYFPTVLSSQPLAEIKYTYGQRLRAHFGVDQVEAMIKKLSEEKGIRSAVAVLWDPRIDNKKGGMPGLSPCLNYIGVKISGDKLILTALIRSNDMFSGWPENAFVLRKLQELIRGGVEKRGNYGLKLGDLVIISQSAHIYEDCWEEARRIVDEQRGSFISSEVTSPDPRGNFVIEISNGRISAEHISQDDNTIRTYTGTSAEDVYMKIAAEQLVSSIGHAIYLGKELEKAEIALNYPSLFRYVQDKHLQRL